MQIIQIGNKNWLIACKILKAINRKVRAIEVDG